MRFPSITDIKRLHVWRFFVALFLACELTSGGLAAETKEFFTYGCRYSLPGSDWSWVDPSAVPNAICVARNTDGLVFMLTVVPLPAAMQAVERADERFAANFDEGAFTEGGMKKRGGRITQFKGLMCYECESLASGKLTAVIRVVIANGNAYQLQLLGNTEPVESRPDFEAIMDSFEFTAPPTTPSAPSNSTQPPHWLSFERRLGQIAGACLLAAIVLAILGKIFGDKWMRF